MKILIASDAWHPQVNGVVRTLEATRDGLLALGHDVRMLTPDRFRSMPCPTYPEIRLTAAMASTITDFICEFAPETIHIATEGPLGWHVRRFCTSRNIPFTTAFHTRFPEYVSDRVGIPTSWSYAFLRRFHRPAECVMASTPALQRELEERGFPKTALFSRGVDVNQFRPVEKTTQPTTSPILLYVGRIAPEKNLDAFLSLPIEGEKVLVGDGPQRAALQADYPDAHFVGTKTGEELARYYAAADVFVFPSKTDTFGLVMLEALACGVPVAAYPVSGPVDVLAGRYIGAGEQDEQAIACLDTDLGAAIQTALSLNRQTCRDYALTFSWEACTRQFEDNLSPFDPALLKRRLPKRPTPITRFKKAA